MGTTPASSATPASSTRLLAPKGLSIGAIRTRWDANAWMSIGVAAVFLGITCWWLTQDRSIPIYDAGTRLQQAISVYESLRSGNLGAALTGTTPYPPVAYLVGALGLWGGGLGVAPPIVAENLVFVSLLALGCYNIGRLAFGPRTGLLAVIFALGSPLVTAQFHVFMTDAPESAMVAVAVWLILASERFSRVGVSALAGIAVGLGLLTKEPFVFAVAGVVIVTFVRGGWRSWRGLAAFAIPALVIAMPWYINEYSEVHAVASAFANNQNAALGPSVEPLRWSGSNLMWYFSSILNTQLYAPLFAFAVVGAAWMLAGLVLRRPISPFSWELLVGAFVGWLGITETFPHDTRYSMPLLVYLAVLGVGWLARLPRVWRPALTSALVVIAVANTLATSFGMGREVDVSVPSSASTFLNIPNFVAVYSNIGFLVAAPHRDGDVLGLMRALRAHGVEEIQFLNLGHGELPPGLTPDFSEAGLEALAVIAGLSVPEESTPRPFGAGDAVLGHGPLNSVAAPPCVTLSDGTGVWVRLGDPNIVGVENYCPFRHPSLYK
jgi:4-amino-4-deoxy-L-arabinose transferase-like glycosyltransferase